MAGSCPLKDLTKALVDDVPGIAEYLRRTLARYEAEFKAGKPCLELQDALSKQPPWSCLLRSTTRCCPREGQLRASDFEDDAHSRRKADAVVQARGGDDDEFYLFLQKQQPKELVSSRRPRASGQVERL